MASKAPESNSASRPMIDEDTFTPPLPPDRNCKDQSERSSDEKCSGPKGLAPQNEKLVSSPASVKSPVDNAESKGMKDPTWKIPLLPSRPSLTSNSTKAHTHSEEQKIKQEDKQNSLQQQSHNEKNSNGAEISSRKRPYSTGDMGNTLEALKAEETALPKELTVKFGPLKCDLCNVSVNSTVQARMHYTGKQHDKKVNQFLANWSRETGQPIPKRIKEGTSAKKVALDPKDMYCTVCDLPLTSVQHAQQHYMGKNHLKATQAKDRDGGKWQQKPQGDPAGGSVGMPLSTDPLGLKNLPDTTTSRKGRFYCELCQVVATSQDQLHMHLKGAKHRKAERAAGIGPKVPSWAGSNAVVSPTIPPAAAADSILASVTEDAASRKPGIKDYSIYRTPSGDYYCTLCTVICNREDVFHTHMISKKHAKHEKAKREREAAAQAATKGEKDSAKEFLSNLKKVISGNVEKVSNNLFFCKLCDLSVNSKEELEQHIATKEHMDKVGKADPYICHVCNMSLESEEHLKLHCTQEEHKKNLQLDVKA